MTNYKSLSHWGLHDVPDEWGCFDYTKNIGWVKWHGGPMPVHPDVIVEIQTRSGRKSIYRAETFYWTYFSLFFCMWK